MVNAAYFQAFGILQSGAREVGGQLLIASDGLTQGELNRIEQPVRGERF